MFPLRFESHFISSDNSEITVSAFSPVLSSTSCPSRRREPQPFQEAFPSQGAHRDVSVPAPLCHLMRALFFSCSSDAASYWQLMEGPCGEMQCEPMHRAQCLGSEDLGPEVPAGPLSNCRTFRHLLNHSESANGGKTSLSTLLGGAGALIMEGLVCKASRLGPSPTDKGAPLWGFSSENHMIKSAFRENTLAMAQRMDWRRASTRGK